VAPSTEDQGSNLFFSWCHRTSDSASKRPWSPKGVL
jgi:hypothetical protein